MGPRLVELKGAAPHPTLVEEVAAHLREGGLVAMPTETVYGFGCLPDPSPMEELRRLKSREIEDPFLLLISGRDAVAELSWGPAAAAMAEAFWPGPLTLVLPDPEVHFPTGVRSPRGGVAVRVSPHPLARALVEAVERPLLSTSANRAGGPPALTASEALTVAEEGGAGEWLWVLDGGSLRPSHPSTIVDCTGPTPTILRAGAVPSDRLRRVLQEIHEHT